MAIPASTFVLGALGTLFLVRGVWNPLRAVVKKGDVASCPGPDSLGVCHQTVAINTPPGSPVLSAGGGKVVSIGPDWVHVQVANEPVILFYQGVKPSVGLGANLWRGQKLGDASGQVSFGVWEIINGALLAIEPSSWLAARGYRIAGSSTGPEDLWCEQRRHILVPKSAHQTCKLKNPSAAGFALLPVSIEQE
jgi:hypothetical protein